MTRERQVVLVTGSSRGIGLDVSSEMSVRSAVHEVVAREGRVDVVVNNAGIMNWGLAEGFTVEQRPHDYRTQDRRNHRSIPLGAADPWTRRGWLPRQRVGDGVGAPS